MRYSVAEIDALRDAVRSRIDPSKYFGAANSVEHAAMRQAYDRAVEEQLRTHMLNGTMAAELSK